ncbi:MAG: carboxymuconolactone decarboxylase family protein [candidate division Zixibacteria bacterium]|nr:carboxymuconolactone decarboxylase family protein [Candidatus Tariuqbacter arcticus]
MDNKTPMDLLKQLAPEFAANQMEAKKLLFENPNYQKVPKKYKILAGIAAAAVLGSELCTEMWTKMARQQSVSKEEISEIIQVARYMKMATVNDTVKTTFAMLTGDEQ